MNVRKFLCTLLSLFFLFGLFNQYILAQEITPTIAPTEISKEVQTSEIYIGEVTDAEEVTETSLVNLSNTQRITVRIISGDKAGTEVDTSLAFPGVHFKSPLRVGERVLLETTGELTSTSRINILSKYKQNNLLIWSFMLIGLFILVSGFRSNIKYLLIFLISTIGGVLVLLLYHRNTYITFGSLFLWQVLATFWFAFKVFKNKNPATVLALSVVGNLLLAMAIVFVMQSINLFDTGFFEIFLTISYDARTVMIYLFAILVVYPLSVVFAEQIISESLKKKKEDEDISKAALIQHVSRSALKTLNIIFLTFFGLFFAIFVCIVAIASREGIVFRVINSSSFTQILSVGFLILFDILIFVPLVSFISGMWLGKFEVHELVTDKNVRQLEL